MPGVCCLPCRPSRSVVLSVRGSNSMEDLLTDMMDRPLDITAWLPDDFKQASGRCPEEGLGLIGRGLAGPGGDWHDSCSWRSRAHCLLEQASASAACLPTGWGAPAPAAGAPGVPGRGAGTHGHV